MNISTHTCSVFVINIRINIMQLEPERRLKLQGAQVVCKLESLGWIEFKCWIDWMDGHSFDRTN